MCKFMSLNVVSIIHILQCRDPDALNVSTNEAYNVVKPTARVSEAVYETVPAVHSVPPTTSQTTS